jgi:hypothetical protein
MLLVKKLLALSLIIFLSSCGKDNPKPTVEDMPQCSVWFDKTVIRKEIVEGVEIDVEYIPVESSACICRMYHFSEFKVGAVSSAELDNVKRCHGLVGWEAKNYPIIQNYWIRLQRFVAAIKARLNIK